MTADDLNGQSALTPMYPAVVLATHYDSGAIWSPVRVTGSRAALPIIDNTVLARSSPSETTRMAAEVARRTITLVGNRGGADALLDALVLHLN